MWREDKEKKTNIKLNKAAAKKREGKTATGIKLGHSRKRKEKTERVGPKKR